MTATIVPASELARRRAERERQRQQREALSGSILAALLRTIPSFQGYRVTLKLRRPPVPTMLDNNDDQPNWPAFPARQKETKP